MRLVNEAGCDVCRLRVGDRLFAICVQQHLVQAGEHTVCLQSHFHPAEQLDRQADTRRDLQI
jgi:hypothetical protein